MKERFKFDLLRSIIYILNNHKLENYKLIIK